MSGVLSVQLGVDRLTLPAAPATVSTWITGFQFKPMDGPDLKRLTEDTKMLIFPGTRVLEKVIARKAGCLCIDILPY